MSILNHPVHNQVLNFIRDNINEIKGGSAHERRALLRAACETLSREHPDLQPTKIETLLNIYAFGDPERNKV